MVKKMKPSSSKEPKKQKERELFSVRQSVPKSKKNVDKRRITRQALDNSDDEQMEEIKKMQRPPQKGPNISKDIKSRERISYDTMVSGTVLGCCVTHVFTDRVLVCLPYRMKGFIPLTHISAPYTKLMHQLADGKTTSEVAHTLPELYRSGQFLSAAVANTIVTTHGFKGLALSLFPSDVNGSSVSISSVRPGCVLQCSIISAEDHGYTLDTGVRGISAAFLPTKNTPTDVVVGVGSVLACAVRSVQGVDSSISLTVSSLPDDVATAAAKPSDRQYSMMTPGTLVQGVVSKSTAQGLTVLLGTEEDYYSSLEAEGAESAAWESGTVSPMHLRGPFDQSHLFRVGQKLQAKILFITNFPRTIHLTLSKTVLNYNNGPNFDPRHGLVIGTVIPSATVVDSNSLGLSVRLSDKSKGFCFISKVPGVKKVQQLAKKYPSGHKLPCKLLAFNEMDQIFLISVNAADIEVKDPTAELQVGMVVPVTIVQHVDAGAKVRTKSGIDGFVRKIHLTDTNMATPHVKLPVGKTIQAKLIEVKEKKLESSVKYNFYFTLKSLLVKSELPIVQGYNEGNVGLETEGVVISVFKERLFMEFCSGVRGLLNVKEFSTSIDLTTAYQPGSVLQVRLAILGNNPAPLYILTLPTKQRKRKVVDRIKIKEKLDDVTDNNRASNSWLSQLKDNICVESEQNIEKETVESKVKKVYSKELKKKRVLSGKSPQLKQGSKKKKV